MIFLYLRSPQATTADLRQPTCHQNMSMGQNHGTLQFATKLAVRYGC